MLFPGCMLVARCFFRHGSTSPMVTRVRLRALKAGCTRPWPILCACHQACPTGPVSAAAIGLPVARSAAHTPTRGAICRCLFSAALSILASMPCPEYLRLERRYEVALRNWVQSMASYLTVEQQRALEERNAAKNRLWVHEQSCSICLRKLAG